MARRCREVWLYISLTSTAWHYSATWNVLMRRSMGQMNRQRRIFLSCFELWRGVWEFNFWKIRLHLANCARRNKRHAEFARTNFNLINSNKGSYRSVKAISPSSRNGILINNFTYFLIDSKLTTLTISFSPPSYFLHLGIRRSLRWRWQDRCLTFLKTKPELHINYERWSDLV